MELTGGKPTAATSLIKKLLALEMIEPIAAHGRGKYRVKPPPPYHLKMFSTLPHRQSLVFLRFFQHLFQGKIFLAAKERFLAQIFQRCAKVIRSFVYKQKSIVSVRVWKNCYGAIGILRIVFLQIQFKNLAFVVGVNCHRDALVPLKHH